MVIINQIIPPGPLSPPESNLKTPMSCFALDCPLAHCPLNVHRPLGTRKRVPTRQPLCLWRCVIQNQEKAAEKAGGLAV